MSSREGPMTKSQQKIIAEFFSMAEELSMSNHDFYTLLVNLVGYSLTNNVALHRFTCDLAGCMELNRKITPEDRKMLGLVEAQQNTALQ